MKTTDSHIYFWNGTYSNWHPAFHKDDHIGICFENTEQAFMWHKAMHFQDEAMALQIKQTGDPREVKKLGRLVKGYDEAEWNRVRYDIMVMVNLNKFDQIEPFQAELLATGDRIIVEASPYDKVWGVGLLEDDPLILDEKNWQGLNLLGKAVMDVRTKLRS